jgi:6-pyruvoyltetrahydropterin/6-carboxytetrahydropterin synthase
MKIVKIIQWDMGHRVMNHRSICRGLHGHRYKAEICVEGDIIQETGVSEEGMVIDFADIKKISLDFIHDKLDHGYMVWEKDTELLNFFKNSEGHKPVIVPFTPTAENVAKFIFDTLNEKFIDKYENGLKLSSVKLWETPTSYALYEGK